MDLIFESSERSDERNKAKKKLQELEYQLITFEGYTISNRAVSLLLDRAKLIGAEQIQPSRIFEFIKEKLADEYSIKEKFATALDVNWYFVVYRNNEKSIVLDMLADGKEVCRFETFKELAEWTLQYREYVMKSRFEENGLPEIDLKMRKINIPWPGNMDNALCLGDQVIAIIEFQNTRIKKVKEHDNNEFFKPTFRNGKLVRKGDEFRWKVLDHLREHTKLPLLTIVWSADEEIAGLKLVGKITYTQEDADKAGIEWEADPIYVPLDNLGDGIKEILNI